MQDHCALLCFHFRVTGLTFAQVGIATSLKQKVSPTAVASSIF